MGKTVSPARAPDAESGSRTMPMSRGAPSARAASASRITVGRVQLPPSQPWNSPSGVTTALSPTRAELGGSRRTTVASAKASLRPASSDAS